MTNSSKPLGESNQFELLISVPSRVWVRIRKAGKTEKFTDAVALNGVTFIFDIEGFCEGNGIQLSKVERALVANMVKDSDKNLRPRLVK